MVADSFGAEDRVHCYPADATDEAAVFDVCQSAAADLRGLDSLYNNAGVYLNKLDRPVDELPLEVWNRTLEINATGVFLFCKHALPHLRRDGGGVLINVSSTAGHRGDAACHAYAASKGAVIALTLSIAQHYGREGIRAIALCPGFIETPMVRFALEDPAIAESIRKATALARFGTPDEIAATAAFLLSNDASFITSTIIDAHGGLVK